MGNIFAARKSVDPNPDPVLMGSHLDTQATGGRFDGVYGVMAGLEVMRVLATHGVDLSARWKWPRGQTEEVHGCACHAGSGVVAEPYAGFRIQAYRQIRQELQGELRAYGYRGTAPARARPFRAMFEAHIEQGPILENLGATIGVVAGIQGAYWFDVTLEGLACHAGPTPMEMRRDPWRAATTIIESAFAIAKTKAPWGRATIGDLKVSPGARNTVPERLVVAVDLRHPEPDVLEEMVAMFREQVAQTSARTNIDARIELIWHMPATRFDTELVGVVDRAAQDLGFNRVPIVSGAGHDSLHTAQFAPTAMIFVPCAGGLSHNEAESATSADLAAGANVLLQSVLCVANN
ncbi:MAG: hydantoinase/carbamoylase family amidase [Proteobacteria bacterium]|nr:hydantoinase/carbamoylase family amidase [Pseudomonadota bacterium]